MSTVQRAYALARSGQFRDVDVLKDRLKAEGCRAVDALLAARSIRKHLEAICAATFKPPLDSPTPTEPQTPPEPPTPTE